MDIAGINTLSKLAHRSGVPIKTLRGLIRRNAIGQKTAERISERLNIPYKWIKDGVGSPPSPEMVAAGAAGPAFPLCTVIDPWAGGEHLISQFDDTSHNAKTGVRMRIRSVAEAFGLETPLALAVAAGLSADLLSKIMADDDIDAETAAFAAKRLGIECAWLLKGEGPMEKPGSEIEGYKGEPSAQAAKTLARATSTRPKGAHGRGPGPAFCMVPKAQAKLSAGGGIVPEEGTTGEEYAFRLDWLKEVATSTQNVILIDVDGDSMAPTLLNKDTVLIDMGRTELRGDRIYAIAIGDVVSIKRLQRLGPNCIRVIADNPAYYTHEIHQSELHIIGQMIWFSRIVV